MVELRSTITCPQCGARHTETMPTNACDHFVQDERHKGRRMNGLPGSVLTFIECPS